MNILTFDIEEWFHILDNDSTKSSQQWSKYPRRLEQNAERILSILSERDLTATFFCLGWVARHFPEVIKKIADNDHEIATHSDQHQLAYMQSPEQFRTDLRASIQSLEDLTGKKVTAYRAPGFSIKKENSWVFDILIEEGITIDCSIFPARRSHGGFSEFGEEKPTIIKCTSGKIKAFPINTQNIFGKQIIFTGGGYFRLIPYSLIHYFSSKSDYIMTYFHPRDFDAEQPIIEELSRLRKFKSYYGLKQAQNKLEKYLDNFEFISLKQADLQIDWDNVKTIEIIS